MSSNLLAKNKKHVWIFFIEEALILSCLLDLLSSDQRKHMKEVKKRKDFLWI